MNHQVTKYNFHYVQFYSVLAGPPRGFCPSEGDRNIAAVDSISRKQCRLLAHHLHSNNKSALRALILLRVEMVEIESTSENVRSYESTVCSSPLDLDQAVEGEPNDTWSSFEEFGAVRKRGTALEPDVYITTITLSDMRLCDAARASEWLRYSWCESERVSVRTEYAFLSTYEWTPFNEVTFNFDTAHIERGKPSKPVIPS